MASGERRDASDPLGAKAEHQDRGIRTKAKEAGPCRHEKPIEVRCKQRRARPGRDPDLAKGAPGRSLTREHINAPVAAGLLIGLNLAAPQVQQHQPRRVAEHDGERLAGCGKGHRKVTAQAGLSCVPR